MGTTSAYLATLKEKLNFDAAAKRQAYQDAYDRATQASFDAEGRVSYNKNNMGENKYGTLDTAYLNQQRTIGAGAEASGMMRSGQVARDYATSLAGYKADVLAAGGAKTAGQTEVENARMMKEAEYDAMYGTNLSGGSDGGATSPSTSSTTTTGSLSNNWSATTKALASGINPASTGLISSKGGVGGAAAASKVKAPGVPEGANPYAYVPKTGVGAKPTTKPVTQQKAVPKVPPARRTGPL